MEKYLRYKGEFYSVAGVRWRVEIWQDAIAPYPVVGRLDFPADEPLVIEWKETDKLEPVQSSMATLTVVSRVDRQYKDLYAVEVGSIRMDVYREGSLYWSGSLDTELYEEPFSYEKEYEVTLTFSDFAVLERIKFHKRNRSSILEIIEEALKASYINYQKKYQYISTSRQNDISTEQLLTHTCVNCGNFYDEDDEPMDWRKVLEETLRPFTLRIIQRCGNIYIYDLNAVHNCLEPEMIEWESTDAILGVDKICKSVKVVFSPYDKTSLLKLNWVTDHFTPYKTDLLVRQNYSVGGDGQMNAPEGFYIDLFQNSAIIPDITIHKSALPFKINGVYSSGAIGEGIAWIVKIGINQNSDYNSVLTNPIFMNYEPLIKINKNIDLPNIWQKSDKDKNQQRFLHLKMGVLFDVRYNPFEQAIDYNEVGDYQNLRYKARIVHIPFKMRFKDVNGNVIKHYTNVIKNNGGYFEGGAQSWVTGDYPIAANSIPYAVLSYYTPPREDKITKLEFAGGWMENYQCLRYPSYQTSHRYDVMGPGEYIPIPEDMHGTIELEIGTGTFNCGNSGFVNSDIGRYRIFDGFEERVRWLLYKIPELDIVNGFGKTTQTKDIEYTSWINNRAKEGMEVDFYLGTGNQLKNSGLGILLKKEDNKPILGFTRAEITDSIEKLFIGTVYSQYNKRMNVLSGTCKLISKFGVYTDSNEPGYYCLASDVQHLISDESEAKFLQMQQDNYKGIDYEKGV